MGAFVYIVSCNLNGYGREGIEEKEIGVRDTRYERNRSEQQKKQSPRLIDLGDKVLSSFELPGPKSRVANMYL